MQTLDRRDQILRAGMAHFSFTVENCLFGYAYIRKNACSAFKRLICETSTRADFARHQGNKMDFLNEHHRIRTAADLGKCDKMIFVYRDPYERLVSAFVNKFVVRQGHEDIFENCRKHLGHAPETTTFVHFATEYCQQFNTRDVHIRPQVRHLLPVEYHHAIALEELQAASVTLFGQAQAGVFLPVKRMRASLERATPTQLKHPHKTCMRPIAKPASYPPRQLLPTTGCARFVSSVTGRTTK